MCSNRLYAYGKVVRAFILIALIPLAIAIFFALSFAPLRADDNKNKSPHEYYFPIVIQPGSPGPMNENAVSLVNQMRAGANIPPVTDSGHLNNNCFEHARYMAENNVLSHEQDPSLPYASTSGQNCAQNANAWLGSSEGDPAWTPDDSIQVWMGSVGHRLWLLYPTTQTVGYGFFTTQGESRAAAAVDVLSSANFAADEVYAGWPVQYPEGISNVPATRYPITLNWRYFGPKPELSNTRLQLASGLNLAHEATTTLPAGHKGIQIIPMQDLPPYSQITVTINGSYDGQSFSHTWEFQTGG